MSALKDQLRLLLPKLSAEANANQTKEIKRHLYLIRSVCESKKSVKQVCGKLGVSTDQFYLWGKRLKKFKTISCLAGKSRKPKYSPRQTKVRIERKILALRKAEPSHGPERISFDLRRLFNIVCAPGTVYNVLKRLKLISKEYSKKLTKRHHKRYRRPLPGYMQIDIKYVPYRINGAQFYEFNIVDHCTTWRLMKLYRNINYENIILFLRELEEFCPFPIFEIQSDNGIEFTDKYRGGRLTPSGLHPLDLWCAERNIIHRLIPIGQKELNGKVENTHKQDDREFFAKAQDRSFEKLEKRMQGYNDRWNNLRFTKALGWKTPNMCIEESFVQAIAYLRLMGEKYAPQQEGLQKYDTQGNAHLPLPKDQPPTRKTKKTKTPTAVDRYLKWLDWDQKNRLKSILTVPFMFQNFSSLRALK